MALEDGTIKLPEDRPDWDKRMEKYCTPKGVKSLDAALSIFAPQSASQLYGNPALNIDVRRRADEAIEAAVQAFIGQTTDRLSQNGVLKKDLIVEVLPELNDRILAAKYPEYGHFGELMSEAFVLNEVKGRLVNYLLAMIASKENGHRISRNSFSKGRPVHNAFFHLIDRPGDIMDNPNMDDGSWKMLNIINTGYKVFKTVNKPFFEGARGAFSNPENKERNDLKKENDRIALEILRRRKKEVPLCTIQDSDLFVDKPIVIQFSPSDSSSNNFQTSLADVHLFEADIGAFVENDPRLQSALMSVQGNPDSGDHYVQFGNLPRFSIDRFRGELNSFGPGSETSKVFAGKTPNYELTRRRILWYLAQLTCYQADVEEIFGISFEKKKIRSSTDEAVPPKNPANPSGPDGDTVVDKTYPTERAKRAVNDTLDGVRRGKTSLTGHTRLLPLIRKANGDVIPCKPSVRAQGLAANEQIPLETGFEILNTGEVIYPEHMRQFLASMGAKSIEEVIALDPDNVSIRYETWVEGHGKDDGVEAIRAHVRSTV